MNLDEVDGETKKHVRLLIQVAGYLMDSSSIAER